MSGERGKIVCAYSPKGGTGRSTLLANLAVATKLATKKRVALFDADLLFGDLAVLLNLPVTKTITDLAMNIRQLDDDLLADVMVAHSSGIKVLLAPPSPQQAEKVTTEHLRLVLQTMVNSFDYVFVDLPLVVRRLKPGDDGCGRHDPAGRAQRVDLAEECPTIPGGR